MAWCQEERPSYKVLFESGYYQETIDLLTARLSLHPDSNRTEYRKYLAFSLIMTGRVREADSLFKAALTDDSLFRLDPVRTSPKIYDVYYSARVAWQKERPAPVMVPLPSWRYGLYLCPFGAGQFYHREKAKGAALCVFQALALGASFIYYNTRQDLYSPDYGWYEGNLEKNRSTTTGMRVTFGLASAAWAYGVIDAFLADKHRGLK